MINYSEVKEVIEAQAAEKAAAEKAAAEKAQREEIEWNEKYDAAQLEYKALAIRAAINTVRAMTDQIAGVNKLRATCGIQGPTGLWIKWQYYLTAGMLAEAVKADPENPVNLEAAAAVSELFAVTCESRGDADRIPVERMLGYLKRGRVLVPVNQFLENHPGLEHGEKFDIVTFPAHATFNFLDLITGSFESITAWRANKGERDISPERQDIMAYLREDWESDIFYYRLRTEPEFRAAVKVAREARRNGTQPAPSPAPAPAARDQAPRRQGFEL
jgi:hypothetical protein